MNHLLALTAGIGLAIVPLQTAHADHHHVSGRSFSVAPHFPAPLRSFSAARSFRSMPHTTFRAAPLTHGNFHYSPTFTQRSFAFGGHALNRNVRVQPTYRNSYYGNRYVNRTLPSNVIRDWDRRHDHDWNHHHYRWFGNSWVIVDGGYGDPYYYDDGYYSAPYVATAPDYDSGNSLAADVQEALAAQGYYHYAIDGEVGLITRDAIAAYQRDHGLAITATINTQLLNSLGLE